MIRTKPVVGLALLILSAVAGIAVADTTKPAAGGDVRALGAKGDGTTKDTAAFQAALDACAAGGGGEVRVPAGTYLIGSVVMGSGTTLRLEEGATLQGSPDKEDYPVMQVRWEGRWREGHRALIHAKDAKGIAIVGPGRIVGANPLGNLRNPRGPALIEPIHCEGVRLEGFSTNYSRMWAIHPTNCQNVVARGLTIRSEHKKSNGDGIDVDSCKNVLIEKCDIDAGDDAIALKSGRGMEAVRLAQPTEDVVIRDCRLGSDFAAIALGTEMSGGIRNVRIENCVLTPGSNGIYIKSRTGRGGVMENISGKNITNAGPKAFVRIELTNKGIQDSEPVEGTDGIPVVRNVSFEDVKMAGGIGLEAVRIDPQKPVVGLRLANVTGTADRGIVLDNVREVELSGIEVSGFKGPKVRAAKGVTGKGLEGAEEYVASTQPATGKAE
jgi:polygalacturonase